MLLVSATSAANRTAISGRRVVVSSQSRMGLAIATALAGAVARTCVACSSFTSMCADFVASASISATSATRVIRGFSASVVSVAGSICGGKAGHQGKQERGEQGKDRGFTVTKRQDIGVGLSEVTKTGG